MLDFSVVFINCVSENANCECTISLVGTNIDIFNFLPSHIDDEYMFFFMFLVYFQIQCRLESLHFEQSLLIPVLV